MSSSVSSGNAAGAGKFTLFTAGLHNKILIDSVEQQQHNISPPKQISARSKLSQAPGTSAGNKQKPKRPSSANPRVRSSHQHREPGKPQKNHPILSNPNHQPPPPVAVVRPHEYEGRNFAVLNKEELLEALTEIKKQQRGNETLIAQLRADNQRLESEVLKQQHRIDKLMSPQFAKNSHLLIEIRKEIEKSVLVRQLKAQMLSLRGTITDKESIIESLQKKTGSAHLIELSAEKEEYFLEIQRLKKMLLQKEKELQQEKSSHAWQKKGENITLEDNLKAEITRLSRGYQQVLEKLETTTAATNASKFHHSRIDETDHHSAKPSSSRPSSAKTRRPKSAGSKGSASKTNNALDYLDPILTTFDPPNPTAPAAAPSVAPVNLTANASNIPPNSRPKEPDFLYEMSEENVLGMGGESSVEAYLVTNKGLTLPQHTPLPMGCKIEVRKVIGSAGVGAEAGAEEVLLEGRVCGYNAHKDLYDVQYEEGGREFDVSRDVILVMGERQGKGQGQQEQKQEQQQEPSPRRQSLLTSVPTHSFSAKESVCISIRSLSGNGLRHVEYLSGENDPYAMLSYGDSWSMTTSVQDEGGSDVMWEFHPSEGIEFDATPEMLKKIPIRVMVLDKNMGPLKDTVIGTGEGSLSQAIHSPYDSEIRINIPLVNGQGRAAGTVILAYVVHSHHSVSSSSPSHQGSHGKGNASASAVNSSPRKGTDLPNSLPLQSKYQVGDEVEGNFQRGGSWYPGIILGITASSSSGGGVGYRIRYRDGDEEGQVSEENIRYTQSSTSGSQQTKPQQQQQGQQQQGQQQQPQSPSSSPRMYLPEDRVSVECSVPGGGKKIERIAIIEKVHMDGTYDLLFTDGSSPRTERNVSGSSILRALQPEEISWPIQQPQHDIDDSPHTDSPTNLSGPLYAIGNRVEGNFRSRGKWYPGVVSDVKNHGESYRIDYDDGEVEEGVVTQNLRLKEVSYNIDSLLGDDEEGEGEGDGGAGGGGAGGLTTNDLMDDNYFKQFQNNSSSGQEEKANEAPRKQPSVDINSFLDGLSDDDEGDGDVIGGDLDGGDSINLDYGVCAAEPERDAEEDGGDDVLNQTNEYGDDFDD